MIPDEQIACQHFSCDVCDEYLQFDILEHPGDCQLETLDLVLQDSSAHVPAIVGDYKKTSGIIHIT